MMLVESKDAPGFERAAAMDLGAACLRDLGLRADVGGVGWV